MSGPESLLELRCVPGSRRPGVVGRYGQAWKVRIAAAPEKGRANAELLALLSEVLGLPKHALEITRGSSGRDKRLRVRGLAEQEVAARLQAACE